MVDSDFVDVVDFDGSILDGYRIARDGRMRSCRRNLRRNQQGPVEWYPIYPPTNRHGYQLASICRGDGVVLPRQVHALVLLAFVGPPPTRQHQCRHLDGNGFNNHVDNLRWGTAQENRDDQYIHGTSAMGTKINTCKLNEDQVREIRRLRATTTMTFQAIADQFGIKQATACQIVARRSWKHVE